MYNDENRRITDLICRSLLGGLEHTEEKELQQWVERSEDNRAMYEQIRREPLGQQDAGVSVEILAGVKVAVGHRQRRRKIAGWASAACVAAVAMLLILKIPMVTDGEVAVQAGAATLTTSDGKHIALSAQEQDTAWQELLSGLQEPQEAQPLPAIIKVTVAKGNTFRLELKDGTKVWLNEESSFEYPERFGDAGREVALKGEAFFEVARDSARSFIVALDDSVAVRVLGTRFNVRNYADMPEITTVLIDGSVEVAHGGETVVLAPGHRAKVAKNGNDAIMVDALEDAAQNMEWIYGMFEFDARPLPEIIEALAGWYGLDVQYDSRLAGRLSEVSFHCVRYADSGKVFEQLSMITGLRITSDGGTIIVDEK